jgi:maltose alpha-D-glucosyltransferase / alpha-amylase
LLQSRRSFAIATLHGPSGDAVLYDALADDEFCTTLLNGMGSQVQVGLHDGRIQGVSTEAFAPLRGRSDYPLAVVRGPATSSNSLVFFGRRLLFKLFRRLEPGTNPDFEIGRFLTEGTRFERTPKVAGTYEYFRHDGSGPFTLGILQSLVPNQGDGWSHATEELSRYFERAAGRMFGPDVPQPDARPIYERIDAAPPPSVLETIGSYHFAAEVLGKRTAEMHLALASEPNAGSFSPEPLEPADIEGLRQETMHQADRAFSALQGNVAKLQGAVREMAERLLEQGKDALEGVIRSWSSVPDAAKTRVHGDYHLGQVLWAENDYIILDFEGEPTRTVDERREKFSPLRDVAGMLRSYHYAAYAGLFSFTQDHPDDFAQLEPWADLWQQWVSAAFLASYLKTARDAPFIPRQRGELALLLDGFTLAKALYELAYELNNRPDWVRIPLSGVWQLLEPQIERTTNQPQGSTS